MTYYWSDSRCLSSNKKRTRVNPGGSPTVEFVAGLSLGISRQTSFLSVDSPSLTVPPTFQSHISSLPSTFVNIGYSQSSVTGTYAVSYLAVHFLVLSLTCLISFFSVSLPAGYRVSIVFQYK